MVLLHLSDKQKEKISLLNTFDEKIIREFCRISTESINKEINTKAISNAAAKLNIQPPDLKELIELITWIFLENARLDLNVKELKESLLLVGIKEEIFSEIELNAKTNQNQLQNLIDKTKIETLSYDNLEWRVDIKLATRSLLEIVEPEIVFKFDLKKGDERRVTKVLQTDVVNLNYLTNSLENALNEIKSNYCRKVFRNIV
ncbi:unnamed protein product [Brachionus calyciflorus]|uniref:COMM domain-containing protein n=1 Tax=Brachionus calyciflorus TaxID=104777 RepID=A0A813MXK4_9BILA|nr:unnamed protein product [Brachionus calyciflorus]